LEGRNKIEKKDGTLYWVELLLFHFSIKFKPYQYISIRSDIQRKQAEEDF
jgi:hypothetical protein